MEPKRRARRLPSVTAYASAIHERRDRTEEVDVDVGIDLSAAVLTFEQFYASDRVRIGRAIALALGDPDLAAEATDEAFTRAYERWATVSRGNPGGWVYRVAMNWALSVLRRNRRRHHGGLYDQFEGSATAVHDRAMGEPSGRAALAALDPKHSSVVECRHLLGWSVAETARTLRIREGTVKSRLSRANQILQTELDHLRPEEQA